MPNAVVKSYAKKIGKPPEHVEGWWKEAEAESEKKFKGKKGPRYWAYVNGIVKRRAGLAEATTFKDLVEMLKLLEQGEENDRPRTKSEDGTEV
jgi:hypothetical protein